MEKIDKDDVSYLALAFEIGSHAILSFDNIFHKQGDIRVWKHSETDTVVTNYHSGFISFCLMGNITNLFARLIGIILRFLRDAIIKLVEMLAKIAQGIITGIASLPPVVLVILIALGIIFFDDIQKAGKDIFKIIKEKSNEIIAKLKIAIKELLEIINKVLEVGKLGATVAFEFLGFLVDEYSVLQQQLESLRTKSESSSSISFTEELPTR